MHGKTKEEYMTGLQERHLGAGKIFPYEFVGNKLEIVLCVCT